jgi:GNAT superfamily N-acetyltransferase
MSHAPRTLRGMTELVVHPVSGERLDHLAALFGTTKTTAGCHCMWNILPAKASKAGWSGGNRVAFEERACAEAAPMGLLAYRDDEPVGWIAAGPRSRYERALGTPSLAGRDPGEDSRAWLVTCFYVRRSARGQGVTRALLRGAIELARKHRATAIEGWPLAGDGRHAAGDAYVGVETLFTSCGFTPVRRPTDARVIMRLPLT